MMIWAQLRQARLHRLPTQMAAPTETHAANTSSSSRIKLCDKLTQPVSFLVEVSPVVKLASVVLTGAIALLRGPVFIFIDPVVISTAQTFEPAVSTALMALRRSSGVERTGLRSVLPPLGLVFREGTAMPCHQPILKARHTCHSVQMHRSTVQLSSHERMGISVREARSHDPLPAQDVSARRDY